MASGTPQTAISVKLTRVGNARLLLLVVLLAVPAAPQDCRSSDKPESRTKEGQLLPPFHVTDISGKEFSLNALKGKVVLLNFWATWCAPCRQEMPRLQKEIWLKYQTSPKFAMIAIAREQTRNEIDDFREQSGFTFPMAPDPKRSTYKLFADAGIPRSYVISPTGKILFQTEGYCPADFDQMEHLVQQQLSTR